MLGKVLQKGRADIYDTLLKISTKRTYDISETMKVAPGTGAGLPEVPANPYKKRPLKLKYDKNEFHAFRLPSENHFLLSSYDS